MDLFIEQINTWYSAHKRALPWRETSDPYHIWLSEIILQQTRVQQGINYYHRFIEEFPTVFDLANASEDQVLKLWQGLGYYSRARNLHSTAQHIVNKYNGVFPNDYKTILSLKGIGPYTAAAIASIAFDLPYPAIDGNVYRIVSRYFGINSPIDSEKGKNEIYEIAKELMPGHNAGFHNQALMEFGALQCIPKAPNCSICPLIETCYAAKKNLQNELPVKTKKAKQRIRFFYYFLIDDYDSIYLEKRESDDIWRNLYQLPLLETEKELTDKEILAFEFEPFKNLGVNVKSVSGIKKHVLSHQLIMARLVQLEITRTKWLSENYIRVNKKDIYKFAVPKLIEAFLQETGFV